MHRMSIAGKVIRYTSVLSCSLVAAAHGQSHGAHPSDASTQPTAAVSASTEDPKLSVTHHQMVLDGQPFTYRATAGLMAMKDESAKPKANIFYVAYDTEAPDLSRRPLTFLFNGGPGAAAVWLHLGGAGPKTIDLDDQGIPIGPPFKLVDNQATWMRGSDLVFVDPVSTGYSRPAPGKTPSSFMASSPTSPRWRSLFAST